MMERGSVGMAGKYGSFGAFVGICISAALGGVKHEWHAGLDNRSDLHF